jgi:penicillin-binding protein 2
VVLTVDSRLQQALYDAFERHQQRRGAAVVLEVSSGRVLALVSRPSLDPNLFTKTLAPDAWARILDDPEQPMLNRGISVAHAPGSTFKPFVALAALSTGVPADRAWVCGGELDLGQLRFRCSGKHGSVTIGSALERRCHLPFFAFAADSGPGPIARVASAFGFGQLTGVTLPDEVPGRSLEQDSPESPRAHALNAAIGQGDVAVTPMQLVVAYAAIANGGSVLRPQLLERVVGPGGTLARGFRVEERRRANAVPAHLEVVRRALQRGWVGPRGWEKHPPPDGGVSVALARGVGEEVGAGSRANGWAAGYAPADKPILAFVVLAERTRDASVAETIAVELLAETLVPRWCEKDSAAGICVRGARP